MDVPDFQSKKQKIHRIDKKIIIMAFRIFVRINADRRRRPRVEKTRFLNFI
jgi:hypothetical protein